MPAFSYTARTRTGDRANGTLDATDKMNALAQIERMGYVPISVKEGGKAAEDAEKSKGKKRSSLRGASKKEEKAKKTFKKVKIRDILLFSQELRDLLRSGMTLGTALEALSTRGEDANRDGVIGSLRDDITQGLNLSEAMEKFPETFPQFYVSMVRAGEASGQLPDSLDNVVVHFERVQEAKESVSSALVYPVFVLVVGVGTMVFCLMWVIPKFKQVFEDLGQDLPGITRLLLGGSDILIKWWWIILLFIFLIAYLFKEYINSPAGKYKWHGFLLRVPIVKSIIANNAFAQFSRTLGNLLKNGVPVLSALRITQNITANKVIAGEIERTTDRVQDGSAMSQSLREGGVFPRLFTDMLTVGEQTGDVPGSLANITRRYESDLKRSLKNFTTILEPIFMLVIASMVGFVALALLMAVFRLTSGLG